MLLKFAFYVKNIFELLKVSKITLNLKNNLKKESYR